MENSIQNLLDVKGLGIRFGGLRAVEDFDLHVRAGGLYGIIGPNGAGKTTVFNMLTGIYLPTEGSIVLDGESMAGKKIHEFTANGIGRTFQNIRLFKNLSVLDNIKIALHRRVEYSLPQTFFRTKAMARREEEIEEESLALLERLGLSAWVDHNASGLPYGLQRRLEMARALATSPRLLLLDEPAAGMNPQESYELMDFIVSVADRFKICVLLIEHHMQVVMGICSRIYVLDYGITIAEGTPAEIQKNQKVIDAYLGVE